MSQGLVIVPQSVDLSNVGRITCNTVTAAWLRESREFMKAIEEHAIEADHDGFAATGRAYLYTKGGILITVLHLTQESARRLVVTFHHKKAKR